jgi:hypothetical protein
VLGAFSSCLVILGFATEMYANVPIGIIVGALGFVGTGVAYFAGRHGTSRRGCED